MDPTSPRALEIEAYAFATLIGPVQPASWRPNSAVSGNGERRDNHARERDQTAMRAASHLIGAILGRSHRGRQLSLIGHWPTAIRGLVMGIAFLATSTVPSIASNTAMSVGPDARAALALLPADHPEGIDAAVKLISLKRAANLQDPTVSSFIVDYEPGGSAVLHHRPGAGYVLVHILSGSIQAEAWSAGVGVYRSGETWVEPTFANNIVSKNASTTEKARALVILVTGDVETGESE